MIIALAGHVDHGKTSLVRALTGIETDRLKEEQERGLTIDLGFAYCDLGGQRVGFVDVPGHHRFVHNMLAGIAPSQLALLVVAADDGVMPQTREHLRILKLLGITRGLVALTKVDRANASQQQQASDGIRALTAGTFLEASPVLSVSSQSGAGIDALREALANQIAQAPQISSATIARLPIDRSFSQRGSGTIVSGTLRDGTLALEDRLWLFPGSQQTRVRSLHVNGSAATVARSGDRCAINLAGIELSQAHRGSWLTSEPMAEVQRLVIDYLQLDDRPLKHWSQVHAYHATTHAIAHAAVLDATRAIASGEQALIQLELNTPLLARAGDRIILRDHGQDRTLGGGTVVDHAEDQARRRELQRVTRFRDRATHPDPSTAFVRELEQGPVDAERFQARWGLCRTELESLTESAAADAQELNGWWVTTKQLKAHQQQALRRFNE
ncbi:MAG: selenocysteine-specific translation elongation factor, partial [Pseudomonadota bacterium]